MVSRSWPCRMCPAPIGSRCRWPRVRGSWRSSRNRAAPIGKRAGSAWMTSAENSGWMRGRIVERRRMPGRSLERFVPIHPEAEVGGRTRGGTLSTTTRPVGLHLGDGLFDQRIISRPVLISWRVLVLQGLQRSQDPLFVTRLQLSDRRVNQVLARRAEPRIRVETLQRTDGECNAEAEQNGSGPERKAQPAAILEL